MTTQNCAECGTRAEPGQSFCDACGSVLSWEVSSRSRGSAPAAASTAPTASAEGRSTGSTTPPPPPAPAPTATAAPAPAPADPAAPTTPIPTQRGTEEPPAATAVPGTGLPGGASTSYDAEADTAPRPNAAAAAPASDDTMTSRARSLLVPVADPEARPAPVDPAVAPVLPGIPVADRPQVRAPGIHDGESGPPCVWCATPNRVDRHYCVRCAMPLAGDDRPDDRPLPWWRRLFRGNRETPWAGDRPRLRRTFDRIGTWIWAAIGVTAIICGIIYIPDGIAATRDHFAKRAPVTPDTFKASRSYPGHKPELAFDMRSNTWWGPGVNQSGEGQWIEARFTEPVRLLNVIITSGTSSRAEKLTENALPHRIEAKITMKDGTTKTRDLNLDQAAGGQSRAFRVGEVTAVRFTIKSAYGASGKKQVSIAEIEFFSRSAGDRT
ncbi:NADase-type glycan-binding domain-containing protein [Streptomyces sp. CRN 30]|uniref:NADase-type glycan-binding domain-containing protein n=1 Tax=Streptomyces sp. CRN 30 TaxID=3075613 RepID=UPI002A83A889|nr:zinc ribbon domain-containing protein [Streptomyces sp. CRN 30]